MKEKILIVSDDSILKNIFNTNVNYKIVYVLTGKEAIDTIRSKMIDLIILDVDIPGISGLDIILILKNDPMTVGLPIIVLTGENREDQIVKAIEYGAEDCIMKPIKPDILQVKIKSIFRKNRSHDITRNYKGYTITLNCLQHTIKVENRTIDLTTTEFMILLFLFKDPGITLQRKEFINKMKIYAGNNGAIKERSMDIHVANLRKKLGKVEDCIKTIYGVGYRFDNV